MNIKDYIHFTDQQFEEFEKLHPTLKDIAMIAGTISYLAFSEKLVVTSIFRKKTTDSGVHEAYRAIDFKPLTKPEYTYRLIEIINSMYTYDPAREMKVVHPNPYHGTACHIHIQCHTATTILTNEKAKFFAIQAKNDEQKFKPMALA